MIILRDTVEIETSPEHIFEWIAQFKENYQAWHPDHGECRYLHGTRPLEEGSVIYCEEYLHGKRHKLKLKITKVVQNSRIDYKIPFLGAGAFVVEPYGANVLFTAELYFGYNIPLLGWLIDKCVQNFMRQRLEAMRQHMVEEGQNLKKILENRLKARNSLSTAQVEG